MRIREAEGDGRVPGSSRQSDAAGRPQRVNLGEANAAWAAIIADPVARSEIEAERALWDATAADGLEPEDWGDDDGSGAKPVKAVLFDLYDTLVYLRSAVVEEARRELARLAGVDADAWADVWRANVLDRMRGVYGGMEDELRLMLRGLGADPPAELVADLAAREHAAWERAVILYPDALPLLDELRGRGYRLGLVSNCSCQAGEVVRRNGIAERLDALSLSCEVGVAKPDPEIFRHACRALGVEPAECMFVADGAFTELDVATALGMVAVKVEQAHQSGDYGTSTRFDHRVTRLADVAGLLPPRAAS